MNHSPSADAAMAVALALAAGVVAQSAARHLRLPGIVLLLGAGVILGPDVLGVVRPAALGPALQVLVGFAVAVILFEGGLNLSLKRLRSQARVIQRLITVGALVTAVGASLAARWIMEWEWRVAIAFGTLVVVTGPTVVTPLLRRIKVKSKVATVLEAEGVLIDAVGAVLAVVTFEVLVEPGGPSIAEGMFGVVGRLGFGVLAGVAGGFFIALALRYRRVVPDGLENVFTLSLVLALFQASNALLAESGIMTVTAAGMIVGNFPTRVQRDLMEFKEQLTVLLIGMLFVLLAADVRIASVLALGVPGVLTTAVLMFVVRPLNIVVSTVGSDLTMRERVFLSWLAPRGIVAAAVASLFARSFLAEGIDQGAQLNALVFSVIAVTVVIQGLSGGMVAKLLDLRRSRRRGYAILGANPLGQELGRVLRGLGREVMFLERDPIYCRQVEQQGFRVVWGNILEERTLLRARLDERTACIAVTVSEEINLLIARTVSEDFKVEHFYVACRRDRGNVTRSLVRGVDAEVLFGKPQDLELWALRYRRELAETEVWRLDAEEEVARPSAQDPYDFLENRLLPLVVQRGAQVFPVNSRDRLRRGDLVHFALFTEARREARDWLELHGWTRVEVVDLPAPAPSGTEA